MHKDINGKTGHRNMQGNSYFYGNLKLLEPLELRAALADGITEWTAPPKSEPTEEQQLQSAKLNKDYAIRASFDWHLDQPLDLNDIGWTAGFDSAIRLDAARRLAVDEAVTFYDADNGAHTLTLDEAAVVVNLIAASFQTALEAKNSAYTEVNLAETLEDVEAVALPYVIPLEPSLV